MPHMIVVNILVIMYFTQVFAQRVDIRSVTTDNGQPATDEYQFS